MKVEDRSGSQASKGVCVPSGSKQQEREQKLSRVLCVFLCLVTNERTKPLTGVLLAKEKWAEPTNGLPMFRVQEVRPNLGLCGRMVLCGSDWA